MLWKDFKFYSYENFWDFIVKSFKILLQVLEFYYYGKMKFYYYYYGKFYGIITEILDFSRTNLRIHHYGTMQDFIILKQFKNYYYYY